MNLEFIDDIAKTDNLIKKLKDTKVIGLDVETTGLDPYTSKLLLVQIAINGDVFVLNVSKLSNKFITYLFELIKEMNLKSVGHMIKFDLKFIYHNTKVMLNNVFDTQLAETMIYQGLGKGFYSSLKDLLNEYLFITIDKDTREEFIGHDGVNFTQRQITYAGLDVAHLVEIMELQSEKLEELKQEHVFDLEMNLVPVFADMEYTGIILNKEMWLENVNNIKEEFIKRRKKLLDFFIDRIDFTKYNNAFELSLAFNIPTKSKTKKYIETLKSVPAEYVKSWFRDNINPNSTFQIRALLNYIGLPVESTSERILTPYKNEESVKLILDYRETEKSLSTYGESFIDNINSATGRVHTEFNQLGTATGRISSNNPNMQNIIAKKEYRSSFVAEEGKVIITADYSQAELRLLGAVSGEPEFINAYKNNEDLHQKTADFLNDKRHVGKTMNFGVVYGISPYGLLYNFGIPLEKGKRYLYEYFNSYKVLGMFIRKASDMIWKLKYSTTPFGRKRFFKDITLYEDQNEYYKYSNRVKREGVNHIIQGGSADIVKLAMLKLYYKNPFGDKFKLLLQEHDEIVFSVCETIAEEANEFIKTVMEEVEQPFLGEIPAVVDTRIAKCWMK